MKNEKKERGSGNWFKLLFSSIFMGIFVLFCYWLYEHQGVMVGKDLSLFEFSILTLATYRLTRLFVYDAIMQFVRDWFLLTEKVYDKKEDTWYIIRNKPKDGLRRTVADLLGCPWCAGMWLALFVVMFHYITPWSWFLYVILAVGGVSTFIQITINGIGWKAEKAKIKTKALSK